MNYEFKYPKLVSYESCTFYGHWREESFKLNIIVQKKYNTYLQL